MALLILALIFFVFAAAAVTAYKVFVKPKASPTTSVTTTSTTTSTTAYPFTVGTPILTNSSFTVGSTNFLKYTSPNGQFQVLFSGSTSLITVTNLSTGSVIWSSPTTLQAVAPVTFNVNSSFALFDVVDSNGTVIWSATSAGAILPTVTTATLELSDTGVLAVVDYSSGSPNVAWVF